MVAAGLYHYEKRRFSSFMQFPYSDNWNLSSFSEQYSRFQDQRNRFIWLRLMSLRMLRMDWQAHFRYLQKKSRKIKVMAILKRVRAMMTTKTQKMTAAKTISTTARSITMIGTLMYILLTCEMVKNDFSALMVLMLMSMCASVMGRGMMMGSMLSDLMEQSYSKSLNCDLLKLILIKIYKLSLSIISTISLCFV